MKQWRKNTQVLGLFCILIHFLIFCPGTCAAIFFEQNAKAYMNCLLLVYNYITWSVSPFIYEGDYFAIGWYGTLWTLGLLGMLVTLLVTFKHDGLPTQYTPITKCLPPTGLLVLCLLVFCYSSEAQTICRKETSLIKQIDTVNEPDRMADDFISASLVIAEPGEVLYSVLGHAALHMQCPYYKLDCVFSYESEGVHGKVLRFLLGDLKMGMEAMPLDDYLSLYKEEGRGVREYPLNLPAEVKSELWRMCDELVDEGIYLPYDYIKRGCAISIVHSVDNAIRSANKIYGTNYKITYPDWGKPFDRTLREIFYDNASHGWSLFYCMTLVGGQVDNPDLLKKEKLIAPKELVQTWQRATIAGKPIISEGRELLPNVNEYKGDKFTPLHASLILLLLVIISLFWKREYISWLLLVLQTALGCLMVWLLVSPLPGSEWSWLIIPFNPLPAIFWKWRDKWGIYYAALVLAWSIGMFCAPHRLVEYAHIVWAIAFALVAMKPWMSLILNIKKHDQHK